MPGMPPLFPKKGSRRKMPVAEAYGMGATFNPSGARAAASLKFQDMGGKMAAPKFGGRKTKPRYLK